MLATPSDAHREDRDPAQMSPAVKCGNHGGENVHHLNAEAVRRCYAASGRFA